MYENKIKIYQQQDEEKFPSPDINLFVGSSSIRRWETLAKDMLPKLALNRGFGGSDMKTLLLLYDSFILPYKFSKIFIYEGDNDLSGKHSHPQNVLDLFVKIEEKIQKQCPEAQINFISIKFSPARRAFWGKFKTANVLFKNYCESKSYLNFIDITTSMQNNEGEANTLLFNEKDRIHPNNAGYKILTSILKPYLYPSEYD